MINYIYPSIEVNGRAILLDNICNGQHSPTSEFEASLFDFVRQWIDGGDGFELMTSGSTGDPKRITITRAQMIASAEATASALKLKGGMTSLLCLSPAYIAGKMMIVRSFVTGMQMVCIDPTSNPMDQLVQRQIDFCAMVPMQVYHSARAEGNALKRIKKLIIGGGSLDSQTFELLPKTKCECYATYGMTETISHIALKRLNGRKKNGFYSALPGVALSLDERGCLVIDWKILGAPVRTNDLVELVDSKTFDWLGRWDNIINSGGIKIIPEKLEEGVRSILESSGLTNRLIICKVDDVRLGEKVILIIEGSATTSSLVQVRLLMDNRLKRYESPREILFCYQFIETATGKINRKETLKHALHTRNSSG
ncbi:MAG: AMP-binding protein [Chryseolinea sp.]